jgi:DmsE family decaheme c-type cytochrome
MRQQKPVTRLPIGVVSGKQPGLRAFLLLLLGAGLVCAVAHARSPQEATNSGAPAKGAPHAEFVGSETCATCHEEVAKGFASNPHTRMVQKHGGNNVTCENCHGPGSEHVAGGGDTTKIFNPAKAKAKEVDAKCLGCHAEAHPNFDRSPHAKADVGCTSCHSVHASKDKEQLLKAAQPALCFQCHTDTKPQFAMPFHHKVNEGLVKCSDCHNVHGTFENASLKMTADRNAICTKCHTEVRGPFVFEHAPVKAEGCTSCHTPHGSQNARLLTMPSINMLCNQCHSPVAAATVHGVGAGSASSTPCISCHTMVHGSNVSQAFLR